MSLYGRAPRAVRPPATYAWRTGGLTRLELVEELIVEAAGDTIDL